MFLALSYLIRLISKVMLIYFTTSLTKTMGVILV